MAVIDMPVTQIEDRPLVTNFLFIELRQNQVNILTPDTRKKPLPLANGHVRYITATPERRLLSVINRPGDGR